MIVGFATDVCVAGWDNSSRFFGFDLIELGIEDILDSLVRVNASRKGAATGSLKTFLTVAFGQTKNAHAGTISLLRMFAGSKKSLYKLGCVRANGLGPAGEAVRRPLLIFLMGWRHMLRDRGVPPAGVGATMRSDSTVLEKDLDRALGGANIDLFTDEGVRDAVVVLLELVRIRRVSQGEA